MGEMEGGREGVKEMERWRDGEMEGGRATERREGDRGGVRDHDPLSVGGREGTATDPGMEREGGTGR